MLKNLHPLLNADVLHILASMGHGDTVVLSDANFPAASVAKDTTSGQLIRLDGISAPQMAEAVLSVMPLDTFEDDAVRCMAVVGGADEQPVVQQEVQAAIHAAESVDFTLSPVERHEFYAQARQAYAVIGCGERRFYGCFIFTKGVVAPG